jgi:hypothetical protein
MIPSIFPQSEQKLAAPEFAATDLLTVESDRTPYRWYSRIAVTKGGAAGKGPDPPEPPPMSTDGSAQYPNMMEELDGGEVEGKTKMAFAKMQIPSNLKESYLLQDSDFMIFDEREDLPPTDTVDGSVNERDMMLETIEDPFSQQGENDSANSGSKKAMQKAGSKGPRQLSRSSTAGSSHSFTREDGDDSLNNAKVAKNVSEPSIDASNDRVGRRKHKTVANISSAGRDREGSASRESTPERKQRRTTTNTGNNSNANNNKKAHQKDGDITQQAAKLGLYN